MKKYFQKILDLLFPPICLYCKTPLSKKFPLLCDSCISFLNVRNEFVCSSCGNRLSANSDHGSHTICHRNGIAIFAIFPYENSVARELIHSLKYEKAEASAKTIAFISTPFFIKALPKSIIEGKISIFLIPIPLASKRKLKRGYNQSELIADTIAEELRKQKIKVEVKKKLLYRVKDSASQTSCKDQSERHKNIKGCFKAKSWTDTNDGLLFIIDDVVTSGSTIEEAARALRKAKAPHIAGLSIAKT